MAITRVQQKYGGTGNYPTGTSWTITLTSTPTTGNTLLMYLSSKTALSISSIVQGGSSASWSLLTSANVANIYTYIYALTVPASSNSTITLTLSSSNRWFCSIIEEISGLASTGILDKSASSSGSGSTFSTGTTATTTSATEYWVNVYSYYGNGSTLGDSAATSPTNSYTVFGSVNTQPNPVLQTTAGWVGSGSGSSPFDNFGIMISYKTVSSVGAAGGSVTDFNSAGNSYLGLALAFTGATSGPVAVRRRIINSFMD